MIDERTRAPTRDMDPISLAYAVAISGSRTTTEPMDPVELARLVEESKK